MAKKVKRGKGNGKTQTPTGPTRAQLEAAAEEMVEVMGLEETALNEDLSELGDDELKRAIREESQEFCKDDVVTPETKAVLDALKCDVDVTVAGEELPAEEEPPEPEKPAKGKGKVKKDKPPAQRAEPVDVDTFKMKTAELLELAKTHGLSVPPPYRKTDKESVAKLREYVKTKLAEGVVKRSTGEKKPREPVNKSCFGHIATKMSGMLDEKIAEGVSLDDAVAFIKEEVGKDDSYAKGRFMSHVKHLEKVKGVKITEKDGFYKAK